MSLYPCRYPRVLPLYLFFLAFGAWSLPAQTTLGASSLSGTVGDQTGAVVPGADVVLTEAERGVAHHTQAGDGGRFVLPTVPPGLYKLSVTKAGFDRYEMSNLRLDVGQRATIEVKLKLGEVTSVVSVDASSESVLLEKESNAIGSLVDSKSVDSLPLNGRNFLQLALLAGGSNEAVGRANNAAQIGREGRAVVIAGTVPGATGYSLNGISIRGGRLGELAGNVSVATVDQFRVQQSFFMPDQGPNPSIVNITTRGGSNQFHGQAFEFFRNMELDARSFFAPGPENLKRNQFGFALGGPIVRNRIWFYGGYEGLREIAAFSQGVFTPTAAMFGGNFAEVPQIIYDPQTFSTSAGSRQPFAGNVIPPNRINPTTRGLLQYYRPGSSLNQRPSNLFVSPTDRLDDDQVNARIDGALTDRQNIFGQFIHSNAPGINGGPFPLSGRSFPNELQLIMMQHTYTISPTLVTTLRLGFTRQVALIGNEGREAGDIQTPLGIFNASDPRGVTSTLIQGFTAFGQPTGDLGNIDNNYQLDPSADWIKGSHQFRFGSSIRYRRTWQQNANGTGVGRMDFNANFTARLAPDPAGRLAPAANSGNSFADFLLGLPTAASMQGLPQLPYRFTQYMPYFQDTWKIAKTLTINYAISWFKDTIANPQGFAQGYSHGFDARTGLLKFAALGEISPKGLQPDSNNFAPRLGLAWQIRPQTVVRAGAGVYYSDQQLIELQFAAVGPPFNRAIVANNGTLQPVPQFIAGQNIFPLAPLPALDRNFAANLPAGESFFVLGEDGRTPYISQWNFSLQHALGANDLVELVYMGNSGHKLEDRFPANMCVVGADLFCNNATRPYPRYGAILKADFTGNSNYHAMIAKYQRRMSRGISLRFDYTWGKAINDGWEIQSATNSQLGNCRACDRDFSSFDVRHRAVISAIWEVPFGRGRAFGSRLSRPLDLLAGGWTLTSIGTFQTGTPIIMVAPITTGTQYANHRPNRLCDGQNSDLANNLRTNGMKFFDTSCFASPGPGYFGNSSRAPLHGPGLNNWDIGVQKDFSIVEDVRIQLRGELFNAFNHAQFAQPNANTGAGANFGLVSATRRPRVVQLALKLIF